MVKSFPNHLCLTESIWSAIACRSFSSAFQAFRRRTAWRHTPTEVFCRKVQIRKIQRRDCRGGGEESFAIWGDHAHSTGCVATTVPEVKAGGVATAKLPARFCVSGVGASDTRQQVPPECETETGSFSACSIPMCSHSVFVCGVAHSLACACITAQAETGRGPGPANPRATNKLRILRIFTQINFTTRHAEQSFGRRLFKPHTPRRFTFSCRQGSESKRPRETRIYS